MKVDFHRGDPMGAAATAPELALAGTPFGARLLELRRKGSPSNRTIAEAVLRNPVRIATGSIEEVAAATGVSTATLSRFARTVGFTGYAELRAQIGEVLRSLLQPVEKLRDRIDREAGADDPVREGLERTVLNVRQTVEALGPAQLEATVAALRAARGIYVMGFGLSAHVAAMLSLGLQPFCPQLVNVVEFGGTEVAAGRLMNVGAGDVLVAISFPRYATDALRLARYARDRGAKVIAITDGPASPLTDVADLALAAFAAHPVVSASNVAAVVVVEAIVTAMMVSDRENVAAAARLTDAISSYILRGER
jgi:DNA-binding MurR/RpiR family transcriptional regulator